MLQTLNSLIETARGISLGDWIGLICLAAGLYWLVVGVRRHHWYNTWTPPNPKPQYVEGVRVESIPELGPQHVLETKVPWLFCYMFAGPLLLTALLFLTSQAW